MSQLSLTTPTVMQTGDLDTPSITLPSSQSSQATSLLVHGTTSGEDMLSLSSGTASDTLSLSGGTMSDDGLLPQDEVRQSVANSTNVSVPACLSVPPVGANVEVSMLPAPELMQLYQRSCSRMNFAARLSEKLFDEQTRITHNVSGWGKPKVDPTIVGFIKAQCFEFSHASLLRE